MAEATIDSLRIDIEASSAQAADGLEKLIQKLERLRPAVSAVADNGSLNKLKNQLNKLSQVAQKLNSLSGFDKITQLVNSLKSLNELNSINLQAVNKVSRSVDKLREAVNKLNTMPAVDSSKFEQLISSIRALSGVNVQSFAEFLKSLKSLPTVARNLESMDFGRFADQMQRLANSIMPVARQLREATQAFNHMPRGWSRYISDATAAAAASDRTSRSVGGLNTTLGNLRLRTAAAIAFMRRLVDVLGSAIVKSNQFVENLNLFTVTMGESADEAYKFAEAVNDAMGIDVSDWVRYQGFFQSIGKGFGIASDKADLMSQNLTQLSYDLSSFYNTSVDEAYNKVVSGISGELEPLRRYGFALDEATLKQLAYKKGITQSIETMTQAQKAQLRYIAILEQAGNIGVLGDMSRTIDNSANQLRIFTARVQQLVRAVGNALIPMISAVLPYFTAFVQLLTEAAQSIANFMGFELPRIDLNASPIKNGYDEITAATDAATAATEKFKGTLAGVDQLNIIGSKTESGAGDGTGLNYDLNLDLPSYDFLNGVESKTKEIFEGIKKGAQQVTPYLETLASLLINIGGAIALTRIGEMFKGSGGALKTFFTGGASGFVKFSAGLAGGVASMMLWKNSLKQITKQTDQWGSSLAIAIGGTVAIGAVLTAALGPVGLGITLVGALAGAFWGATEAQAELNRELADLIVYSDKGGMSISGLADGFSGYINGISNSYDDILENTKAFRDNQEAIADASNSVYNLTDKYIALGDEITSDDAAKISANIETIANSIRDNLGIATQSIVDNLKTKFSEFAHQLGMDIDDMVGKFYLLEAMGGEAVAKYKQQADTVVADILAGDTSAEKMQQLQEAVRMLSGGTTNKTLETVSFEKALQEMDFAAVDFSSAEDVKAAFDRVATAAESARNSIDEAWSGQILELDTLKSQYETWGIDIQYDEKFGAGSFDKLFADTRLAMDSSYQQELAKIDSSQALFAGMVDTELEKRINEAASSTGVTLFETMAANWDNYWWHGGILSDRNYAKTLANEKHLENTRAQFADIQSIIDKNYADLGVNSEDYKAIGGYITQGLADGAIENAEQFYNSLDEIADVGANEFKEKYGIHSPSRLFAEYGGFMMAGLAQGIMDNSPSVVSSIEVLYKQMLDEMLVNQALISSQLAKGFHIDTSPDVSVYDYEAAMRPAAFDNDWSAVFNSKQSGEEEKPFVINLYSTVEIDGEAVGEAASKYEKMAAFTNNGRNS